MTVGYSNESSGVEDGLALLSLLEKEEHLPDELLPRLRKIEAAVPEGRICAGYWEVALNVSRTPNHDI